MTGLTVKKDQHQDNSHKQHKRRPIKLDNKDIENVASFTYLGSVIAVDGGTERDGW